MIPPIAIIRQICSARDDTFLSPILHLGTSSHRWARSSRRCLAKSLFDFGRHVKGFLLLCPSVNLGSYRILSAFIANQEVVGVNNPSLAIAHGVHSAGWRNW